MATCFVVHTLKHWECLQGYFLQINHCVVVSCEGRREDEGTHTRHGIQRFDVYVHMYARPSKNVLQDLPRKIVSILHDSQVGTCVVLEPGSCMILELGLDRFMTGILQDL